MTTSEVSRLDGLAAFLETVISPAHDELVVRVTSPGGAVAEFGLAAAALLRLRRAGVRITCCVDRVAASGGYMVACVADALVAAPFAFVGSIGVVAALPNFHRVLTKAEVEYAMFTAGEHQARDRGRRG